MTVSPISDVMSTQSATNASPGCQKKRLMPVRFSNLETPQAQTNPHTTVKKNGAK
jgi:hypothetical protein